MDKLDLNQEILQKLNMLVKLSAAQLAKGKDFKEQVMLLSSVGLSPKDIAEVLGKTSNNVSVTLNYIKKKKG
ncbi:sigma-70 family RNA polymerase sigma factor [Candidatus Woesearchaeota archaeon]|nr:sigma-70 family RNA polymerase sigma factor [Candidatus Woesearchaeota archaeon]